MKHLTAVFNFIASIPNSVLASFVFILMVIDWFTDNFSYGPYVVMFFAILVISICEACEAVVNALKDNNQ